MNEATFQAFATHSMKFVCSELNKKMRLYVPSSNQQSPVDGDGYPYDVGVLLDNAYLVGIEFKVCDGGRFPSWRKEQHDTYVGLTGGAHIELPLYYAYNALDGTQLDKLYEEDQFVPLLEGTNVSTPKDLPGQPPAIEAHENMYDWLIAILSDPGRCERNGWTTISTQNAWDPKSGKSTILEDVLQGFPDIIWLLVTVHNGLRVSWALTSTEMREHVENLRAIWRQKELRTVSTANTKQTYLALMEENSNYIRAVWADLKNQQANADDMGDKPDNDGFKPF